MVVVSHGAEHGSLDIQGLGIQINRIMVSKIDPGFQLDWCGVRRRALGRLHPGLGKDRSKVAVGVSQGEENGRSALLYIDDGAHVSRHRMLTPSSVATDTKTEDEPTAGS